MELEFSFKPTTKEKDVVREFFTAVIQYHGWCRIKTAQSLGITQRTVRDRIRKYGLKEMELAAIYQYSDEEFIKNLAEQNWGITRTARAIGLSLPIVSRRIRELRQRGFDIPGGRRFRNRGRYSRSDKFREEDGPKAW